MIGLGLMVVIVAVGTLVKLVLRRKVAALDGFCGIIAYRDSKLRLR